MLNRKDRSSRDKGETLNGNDWNICDRSSSIDSGITSDLPSSMHSSPSPVSMPHSPTGQMAEGNIHQRPISTRSRRQLICQTPDQLISNSPTESRPSSAFSNYNPLPKIGQQESGSTSRPGSSKSQDYHLQTKVSRTYSPGRPPSRPNSSDVFNHSPGRPPSRPHSSTSDVSNHSRTPRPPSTKKVSTRELRRQQFTRRRSSQTLSSNSSIPNEPQEDEPRILLAVKLPNGERFQRYFRPTERFSDIATCAEKRTNCSFSNCNLFVNQVPKRLISNWKETFHESGLLDRTLLCLEEKDD